MTSLLYYDNPYMREFKARVVRTDGEWVVLNRSAIYPGGGGQTGDEATIEGHPISDFSKDDELAYRIEGHGLEPGDGVFCEIDWKHRYELMKAHTAEHLIFSELEKCGEDVELAKIKISGEKKSVVVNGEVNWEIISEVQQRVNSIIKAGAEVRCHRVNRDDPQLKNIRAKMDRIPGNTVRVVRIGEEDIAACAGLHVADASEIEMVLITGFASGRSAGDYEITFEVADDAVDRSVELAEIALRVSESMGAHPEDLMSAVSNLHSNLSRSEEALKRCGKQLLSNLRPREIGELRVYSGSFYGMDRGAVTDAANELVKEDCALCIFISHDEGLMMVAASNPAVDIDCGQVLNQTLAPLGGGGGGQEDFAIGGVSGEVEAEEVLQSALEIVEHIHSGTGTD